MEDFGSVLHTLSFRLYTSMGVFHVACFTTLYQSDIGCLASGCFLQNSAKALRDIILIGMRTLCTQGLTLSTATSHPTFS